MFIPPFPIKDSFDAGAAPTDGISLQSHHLIISADTASRVFKQERNASLVYYASRRTLLVASANDTLFAQLHKTKKCMLKDKNARGDKSIALHDILLDHQVESMDRALEFDLDPELAVLKIQL